MQQKRCQKQTPKTLHMQHDTGELTSRTQMPTQTEPAVVGTRPGWPPPSSHHQDHHHHDHQYSTINTTTTLQPSCLLQPTYSGWAWCGETQYPLSTSPSIQPPVWADGNTATGTRWREPGDGNPKERIRGRKEQTEMEERESDVMFHIYVLWPRTEILHLEITRRGIVKKTESVGEGK